ncbi:MAG TPA: hypothetical protein VNZ03_06660 [Terriglobales bacterium]|nr:hypothetical protein [Terriglobales bacterium]
MLRTASVHPVWDSPQANTSPSFATSYDWEFVPEAGKTFADTGNGMCH